MWTFVTRTIGACVLIGAGVILGGAEEHSTLSIAMVALWAVIGIVASHIRC